MEEIRNQNNPEQNEMFKRWEDDHRRGRIFAGLFIAGAGVLFLAREMGVWIPEWVFTWQMLLIVIGLVSGLKHSFRNTSWLIMVGIGAAFLIREFMPEFDFSNYLWPVLIIFAGLVIMLKPRRRFGHHHRRWRNSMGSGFEQSDPVSTNEHLDASAVFGSVKKNIISKDFRGGEVNAVFGGADINLMQADFQQSIELEVNAVFGGVQLIIPPNWEVKSEMTAVLGAVEDKRPIHTSTLSSGKVLVLKGNAVFGGIEIKSY
jgi:predicted membrane protein